MWQLAQLLSSNCTGWSQHRGLVGLQDLLFCHHHGNAFGNHHVFLVQSYHKTKLHQVRAKHRSHQGFGLRFGWFIPEFTHQLTDPKNKQLGITRMRGRPPPHPLPHPSPNLNLSLKAKLGLVKVPLHIFCIHHQLFRALPSCKWPSSKPTNLSGVFLFNETLQGHNFMSLENDDQVTCGLWELPERPAWVHNASQGCEDPLAIQ